MVIFWLQVWKGAADGKKTKRLSQEEIKKQLLESIIINEAVERRKEYKTPKKQQRLFKSTRTSLKRRRKKS